jgi:hypothetical protein
MIDEPFLARARAILAAAGLEAGPAEKPEA